MLSSTLPDIQVVKISRVKQIQASGSWSPVQMSLERLKASASIQEKRQAAGIDLEDLQHMHASLRTSETLVDAESVLCF